VSGVAAERARAIAGSEAARILFPAPTCLQGFDRLLHWDLLPSYGVGFLYGTRPRCRERRRPAVGCPVVPSEEDIKKLYDRYNLFRQLGAL
jgi:hypothetical protein